MNFVYLRHAISRSFKRKVMKNIHSLLPTSRSREPSAISALRSLKAPEHMKNAILMLLLAAMSSGAIAEWVKTFAGMDGTGYYSNLSSINMDGQKATMWTIVDYIREIRVGDIRYRSLQVMMEFDCTSFRAKTLVTQYFTEPMGGGERVRMPARLTGTPYQGEVSSNTPGGKAWELACGKALLGSE